MFQFVKVFHQVNQIAIVKMDKILNELYLSYNKILNDLHIGYPISKESLEHLWALIHKAHFVKYENHSNLEILKILEYYEYL